VSFDTTSPSLADTVFFNGKIATQDAQGSFADSLAVKDGRILAAGSRDQVMRHAGNASQLVDLKGRTVIPGLNDSHLHVIRGGLNFNLELRWDGVPSLADALQMLRSQVARTPAPQWVRVIGGWNELQFAEKRLPTLDEINAIAPDTPVFILHLYDSALLNAAALRAVGYTKDTPNPPGGEIQRDKRGNPTGMLIARPNAGILYATLAKGPKLAPDDQRNSTRHFMRELNRLGVTSAIDAGGGYQAYPDDYAVIMDLATRNELTVRIAYNLFTQNAKKEIDDFAKWVKMTKPGEGDDFLRVNGAGEMLVFSAADFEDFLEPRPDLPDALESELEAVVRLLVANRWPFRLHATYNESIERFLDVFERVNQDIPFSGLRWFFDHCETISDHSIERVKALGGGIAIQHRMAYQGEYFIARYGTEQVQRRRSAACWPRACLSGRAPMRHGWRVSIRLSRCTGWSRAGQWAAHRCTARITVWIEPKRCADTPSEAHGFPAKTTARARSCQGSLPISRRSATTTSRSRKRRSNTSHRS
jgi:predicted amidohydrolase YtcJ